MFAVFLVVPLLQGFKSSMYKFSMGFPTEFVGLRNYKFILSNPRFYHALRVTLLYTLGHGVLHLGVALVVALILNLKLKGRSIFRTIYFLPVICSFVVSALFWRLLLDEHLGLINKMLRGIGLSARPWLESPFWILFSLIVIGSWRWFGFQMMLLLAGLQSIPAELYDAAKVDGANNLQVTRYVTLPLLFPVLFFCIAIILIGSLMLFEEPYILTSGGGGQPGGPGQNALSLALYMYLTAFSYFKLDTGYAMGVLLTLLIMGVSFVYTRSLGRMAGWGKEG